MSQSTNVITKHGLYENGMLQGLGREICADWTKLGFYVDGQLSRGYKLTTFSSSFGDYDENSNLCGYSIRLDVNGVLSIGNFKCDNLRGLGLVRTPTTLYFGYFTESGLNLGIMHTPTGIYCGSFSQMKLHGNGLQLENSQALRGKWSSGTLTETYDISFFPPSDIIDKPQHSDLHSLYNDVICLLANVLSLEVTIISHQIKRICQILRTLTQQYPSLYTKNTWMLVQEDNYNNISFFDDGSAFLQSGPMEYDFFLFPQNHKCSYFIGNVQNKRFEGPGCLVTTDGSKVLADWENGTIEHSKVTIQYANQDLFYGQVDNDLNLRSGSILFNNGRFYEGEFKNGVMHGEGFLRCKSGTLIAGNWIEGEICGDNIYVYRPGKWIASIPYQNNSPVGSGFLLTETSPSNVFKAVFRKRSISKQELKIPRDSKNVLNIIQNLKLSRQKLLKFRYRSQNNKLYSNTVTDLFTINIHQATEEGIVVNIDYKETSGSVVSGYFIRIIPDNGDPSKVIRSKSKLIIARDITPNESYTITAGILRKKAMIQLGQAMTVRAPEFLKWSELVALEQLTCSEIEQCLLLPSTTTTLFSIDEFVPFARKVLSVPRDNVRVGYDEQSCTFIVTTN